MHFTPTQASWLNLVEPRCIAEITTKRTPKGELEQRAGTRTNDHGLRSPLERIREAIRVDKGLARDPGQGAQGEASLCTLSFTGHWKDEGVAMIAETKKVMSRDQLLWVYERMTDPAVRRAAQRARRTRSAHRSRAPVCGRRGGRGGGMRGA